MSVRRTRMPNIAYPAAALSYTEITSSVAITSSTFSAPDTVITASPVTVDGSTRIKITFFTPGVQLEADGAGDLLMGITLNEGATELALLANVLKTNMGAGDTRIEPLFAQRILTPANGSHTYSIRAYVSTNNDGGGSSVRGDVGGDGETYYAAFILIEPCP